MRQTLHPGIRLLSLLVVASSASLPTRAQEPGHIIGTDRFPAFRNLSGLGCGGYGLDVTGNASLSGPVAFSSPCAYVLGHDQVRLQYAAISRNFSPNVRWGRTNNKACVTYGHTFGAVNVALSDLVISRFWDQAFNLQAEYVPGEDARLAGSIGMQDVGGGGGSSGTNVPGDSRTSRSLFGVLTYRTSGSDSPVYVSAGLGTRRFANGFVNASVRLGYPVRAWAEWDGFGFNYGALLTAQTPAGRRTVEIDGLLGITDARYFTAGITIGY